MQCFVLDNCWSQAAITDVKEQFSGSNHIEHFIEGNGQETKPGSETTPITRDTVPMYINLYNTQIVFQIMLLTILQVVLYKLAAEHNHDFTMRLWIWCY